MRTPTCVTALGIASHGVESGAANGRCILRQSRATPQCTPTVLNKQHAELCHTDEETRI